jgi:hypothetical protein
MIEGSALLTESAIYKYFSNGLNIVSEIYFPELISADSESADIFIVRGEVPEALSEPIVVNETYQATTNEFLLIIEGVGRYLIIGKSHVVVQSFQGVEDSEIRLYILSTVLGILLHKNSFLPLHASCIKVGNAAILISGISGTGKSTAALGLYEKGYEILNDDISSIYINSNGEPYVYPGYAHLKLWGNSLEKYGYRVQKFNQLRPGKNKYSFPIHRKRNLDAIPLKAIFFLAIKGNALLNVTDISGIAAFNSIRKNTFRHNVLKDLDLVEEHFNLCSALTPKVSLLKVERAANILPATFADFLEQQMIGL